LAISPSVTQIKCEGLAAVATPVSNLAIDADGIIGKATLTGPATPTSPGTLYGLDGDAVGYNFAVGISAGQGLTTGQNNTMVGWASGSNISTGSGNVCVGQFAGDNIETSSSNTCIGRNSTPLNDTIAESITLGLNATATASNQFALSPLISSMKCPNLGSLAFDPAQQAVCCDPAGVMGRGPILLSGSFVPTISGVGTSAWYVFQLCGAYYMRIGDIVKGNVTFWCNPASSATDPFEINLTLPITPTVAFGSDGEDRLVGQCMLCEIVGTGRVNVSLYGAAGNIIKLKAGTVLACNAGSNYRIMCDFSYKLF
jgi:hypothetical protein